MKTIRYASALILASALLLSACANTIRGVGRDVKQSAQAVEDSVR